MFLSLLLPPSPFLFLALFAYLFAFFCFLLASCLFFPLKPYGHIIFWIDGDRWDFAFKYPPVFNSSLLPPPQPSPNERQASLTLCPLFLAFSSPGFQWLIEGCVRFTELGLGFSSTQRQSRLPGQFPYESS